MEHRKRSEVSAARAEILDLIDALRENDRVALRVNGHRSNGSTPSARRTARTYRPVDPNYGRLVDHVHELQRQLHARNAKPECLPLIQGLEQRVLRLEERVYVKNASLRPPPQAEESEKKASDEEQITFSGVIQGQMLSDMLQLVSSNALSGLFVVEGEGVRCELYFDEGRMCHAKSKDLEGEQAFFSAFGFEQGKYRFRESTELPEARTINSSTQFLILEALRQIDEANGG